MRISVTKNFAKRLKLFVLSQPVLYILCGIIFATSIYFFVTLVQELTTKNYGYHGTHYDFLAFHSAGKTVLDHNAVQLYDAANITALQRNIIPHPVGAAGYMPFLNPPFVAVFLAPLGLLNINTARLLWLFISLGLGVFVLCKLTARLPKKQRTFAILLLLFTFPLFQTFIEGHVVVLVLLGCTASYLYFKKHKKTFSGAWLTTLWVIPQFGLLAVAGLVIKKEWQMLKGLAFYTAAVIIATLPFTGLEVYFKYIKFLAETTQHHFIDLTTSARLDWRGPLNKSSGLNGFFESIIGPNHTALVNVLFAFTSLVLVGLLIRTIWMLGKKWNIKTEAMMFSAALLIACAINPHLYAQDAVIIFLLLPALFVLYKKYRMQAIIVFAAFCNLLFIDQYSRFHFFMFVSVFAALLFIRKTLQQNT
jgi:hypothetical protein